MNSFQKDVSINKDYLKKKKKTAQFQRKQVFEGVARTCEETKESLCYSCCQHSMKEHWTLKTAYYKPKSKKDSEIMAT